MEKELKTLYKKDKKLAIEVAQVLGYKIKAAPKPKGKLYDYGASLKKIDAKTGELTTELKEMEEVVKKFAGAMSGNFHSYFYGLKRVLSEITKFKEEVLADVGKGYVVTKE